jgi:hypothetical protein
MIDETKYYSKKIDVAKIEKFLLHITRAPLTVKLLRDAKVEAHKAILQKDLISEKFWNSIILKYKSGLEADLNDDQIAKIFFNVILK